jgi:prepilin-type N-terminal cleavage/methylation domain-containing protein
MSGMRARQRSACAAGFTLVELLAVIVIILLLVTLLFPAFRTVKTRAMRTVDLSNMRQFIALCVAFAANNDGELPRGTGELYSPGSGWDDMVHFRLESYQKLDKAYGLDKRIATCVTYYDNPFFYNVGERAAGGDTYIGWLYWAGHQREFDANRVVMNANNQQTAERYRVPHRLSDEATTRTLITCMAYTSPHGWGGWLPHTSADEKGVWVPPNVGPFKIDIFEGLNVGLTDGSASWVPYKQLGAMWDNGVDWLYYQKNATSQP